jgi:uncharacterized protein (DUF1697 family)
MTTFVALLRAVNVGGTGKLPMEDLRALCAKAGFVKVRTFIASGNVIFSCRKSEAQVKAVLEARLEDYAGKKMGVFVRTAAEMAAISANNPFPDAPATREIYVHYGEGIGKSKLRIPAAKAGTARNMNTVAKLAELAAQL